MQRRRPRPEHEQQRKQDRSEAGDGANPELTAHVLAPTVVVRVARHGHWRRAARIGAHPLQKKKPREILRPYQTTHRHKKPPKPARKPLALSAWPPACGACVQ